MADINPTLGQPIPQVEVHFDLNGPLPQPQAQQPPLYQPDNEHPFVPVPDAMTLREVALAAAGSVHQGARSCVAGCWIGAGEAAVCVSECRQPCAYLDLAHLEGVDPHHPLFCIGCFAGTFCVCAATGHICLCKHIIFCLSS